MKRGKKENAPVVNVSDFPGLREFFSGYLHEDFGDEYGSAASAARAFFGDASMEEAAHAREEWAKLRKILIGRSIPELHLALQKLGGAWQPQDMEEFQTVDEAFMKKRKNAHDDMLGS
jgi:hypothetical protein